jgi:hypothetical protein
MSDLMQLPVSHRKTVLYNVYRCRFHSVAGSDCRCTVCLWSYVAVFKIIYFVTLSAVKHEMKEKLQKFCCVINEGHCEASHRCTQPFDISVPCHIRLTLSEIIDTASSLILCFIWSVLLIFSLDSTFSLCSPMDKCNRVKSGAVSAKCCVPLPVSYLEKHF